MSRQQNLFEWRDRIVYLASSRILSTQSWLGDVILYTNSGDQDYLIPVENFKLWHENDPTTLLPIGSIRLVDAIEQGTCFVINGRVNDGSPF